MIVLDSNVWIGLFHESDTLHKRALAVFQDHKPPYCIPEYVLIEVSTILAQKAGMQIARTFVEMVFDNRDCTVLVADESFCRGVANAFVREEKAGLSFVDISLVVLAKRYEAITFDIQLARRIKKMRDTKTL